MGSAGNGGGSALGGSVCGDIPHCIAREDHPLNRWLGKSRQVPTDPAVPTDTGAGAARRWRSTR
ncbi:hypothetical protein FAIPA1_180035 [Frankia sp. AiPs1]